MKLLHILFGGYRLVSKNDLNALYGATHAAYSRLVELEASKDVEKEQILRILKEAKQITAKAL